MKNFCLLFLLIILLVGCTPQKRLNRLYVRYPEIFKMETKKEIGTLVTPGLTYRLDTLFQLNSVKTFSTPDKKLSGSYSVNKKNDSIYNISLGINLKQDTLKYEKTIITDNRPITVEKKIPITGILITFIITIVIVLIIKFFKK